MTSYGGYVYEASDIVFGGLVNLVLGSAAYVILQRRHEGFFSNRRSVCSFCSSLE